MPRLDHATIRVDTIGVPYTLYLLDFGPGVEFDLLRTNRSFQQRPDPFRWVKGCGRNRETGAVLDLHAGAAENFFLSHTGPVGQAGLECRADRLGQRSLLIGVTRLNPTLAFIVAVEPLAPDGLFNQIAVAISGLTVGDRKLPGQLPAVRFREIRPDCRQMLEDRLLDHVTVPAHQDESLVSARRPAGRLTHV